MSIDRRYAVKTQSHHRVGAVALLAASAFAVAAGGCGGNAETLSKAEVIQRASGICMAQEKKVLALPQLTSENPFADDAPAGDREKARRFLAGYADALETVRTQLGELALPEEGREQLEGFVEDLGPTVAKLREAERAAAQGDPQALALANEAFGLFEQASKQTAAYGFPKDVCGA
jgi:hypothetical protein